MVLTDQPSGVTSPPPALKTCTSPSGNPAERSRAAYDEQRDGPWTERVKTALRVRWEWLPIRLPDPADIMVIKPHVPNRYEEMIRLRKAVGTL